MALYSAWYYSSKKNIDGSGLYFKYRQGDYARWEDDTNARELIARAFLASSQVWANLWLLADILLTPLDTALALWTALAVTNEPQTLLFNGISGASRWGHAVTVYAWDASSSQFQIYDNNFPGETVTLGWSAFRGMHNYSKAAAYPGTILNYAFEGMGTVLEGSEFEGFYQGAESGWSSLKYKQINITSPMPDANGVITIHEAQNVAIKGNLTGGVGNANALVYYLNGVRLGATSVSETQEFQFELAQLPPLPASTLMLIATNDPRNEWNAYAGFKEVELRLLGQTFFINPGFETGDFAGPQHETHTWQNPFPASFSPEKSSVVSAGTDGIDTSLQRVYAGNFAARVNNEDNLFHISTISQTITVPNVSRATIRFYWAAVLEDPGHPPEAQPYVDIVIRNESTNSILYSKHFYSNDPSYSG